MVSLHTKLLICFVAKKAQVVIRMRTQTRPARVDNGCANRCTGMHYGILCIVDGTIAHCPVKPQKSLLYKLIAVTFDPNAAELATSGLDCKEIATQQIQVLYGKMF